MVNQPAHLIIGNLEIMGQDLDALVETLLKLLKNKDVKKYLKLFEKRKVVTYVG